MRIFLDYFIFDVLGEPSEILSFNLVLPHGILTKDTFTPVFDRYPWLGYFDKLAQISDVFVKIRVKILTLNIFEIHPV